MDTQKKPSALTDYALDVVRCKALRLVGKEGYTLDDLDDIQQELIVDLLERLPKFDPAKATYNTFVSLMVRRKIANLLRDRKREMRDRQREECSLNEDVDDGEGYLVQRYQTINHDEKDLRTREHPRSAEESADLESDIQTALAKLPPDLRQAAELLQTLSPAQVARQLGIPRATFYENHLKSLREIFAAKDLDGYRK
jgi:RNA polymerase sigma-70 factor, ECF subfamily